MSTEQNPRPSSQFLNVNMMPDATVQNDKGETIGTWSGAKELSTGVKRFSLVCNSFVAYVVIHPNGETEQETKTR